MADKKSNLTSYDRKFIATIVFAHMSMTILAISLFGLYYYEKTVRFKGYMDKTNRRLAILKEVLKDHDSELRLRGLEWDYSQKEGIGAELVPEDKTNKGK